MFSSRSSASRPEASRTQTNISDTVTASATANVSSGVRRPLSTVSVTSTGRSTVLSTSLKRPMFATPMSAKFCSGWSLRLIAGGASCSVSSSSFLDSTSPSSLKFCPSALISPPTVMTLM